MDDFNGKRITVLGLGRFGGGIGVSKWLAGHGARVLVTASRFARSTACQWSFGWDRSSSEILQTPIYS